ncbi:MAG: hypothetical protein ACXWFN_08690, partial [Solirubrobacterales bacterium]
AAGVAAAGAAALAVGAGSFEAFPRIEMALDPATLALCAALPALGLAPFARLPRRAHAAAPRPATAGGQGG